MTTPAGTGTLGPLRDGVLATSAPMQQPCGVTVDHAGNLVIADPNHGVIRVVAARAGTFYGQAMVKGHIYTVAGDGGPGPGGSGVPATSTGLEEPTGVAVDGAGNLVIADSGEPLQPPDIGARIRVVAASTGTFYGQAMTAGDIYTIAGSTGNLGDSGDGGPATAAGLDVYVASVRVDPAGNLLIVDSLANKVRVVAASTGTFYGQAMTAGDIYAIAGTGSNGYSGDGGPATQATLDDPAGVVLDQAGNVFISDSINNVVRMVAAHTGTFLGQAVTAGDIYTVAGGGGSYGDGKLATQARLAFPGGLTIDGHGNLVIADSADERVRVVATSTGTFYGQPMTTGHIYTVAGEPLGLAGVCCDGGPATSAQMNFPVSATRDAAGNLLIADQIGHRVRVVAVRSGTFYGQAMTAGDIYTVAGGGAAAGNGVPATQARLNQPADARPDPAGNLLIPDAATNVVRLVAARTGTFYGQAMTAGDIYTVAGTGAKGFSGDGGPATSATLNGPDAVAVDSHGNVVIADFGNGRIRVVAARTGTFYGIAMTAGDIYTVATGLRGPAGVAVDSAGNLVYSQAFPGGEQVDVLAESTGTFFGIAMTAGHTYDVAGNGTPGFSGDGGPAPSAELNQPSGVAVDGSGNLVVADTANDRIRVVAASTGTFYGVAMTAGDIYTVAGNGNAGYTGDGHAATGAELDSPHGIGFDGAGDLLVADSGNSRIRMVTG